MKVYKLTDRAGQTRGGTQWGPGMSHTTDGSGELCSKGWLHSYCSPELAVLLNPIHANITNPRLWKAIVDGKHKDDNGLKHGSTKLKITKELKLLEVTDEIRIRFAILCSLTVYKEESYYAWAISWLENKDRSEAEARAATWSATIDTQTKFPLIELAKQAFDIFYIPEIKK